MLLQAFLERSAARLPEKTALVCGNSRWTYAELEAAANRLAQVLIERGLERGDRVAMYLDNCVEAVVGLFAVLKAGGVFVPVHPSTKTDKLLYLLNNARCGGVVLPHHKVGMLLEDVALLPHLKLAVTTGDGGLEQDFRSLGRLQKSLVVGWDEAQAHPVASAPHSRCINLDLAALIYTSGSTGHPKGVMLTHLNMTSAAESITTYLENTAADVVLNALPLSFDYGLYQVLMTFKVGATLVLEKSFAFPHAVLQTVVREGVTGLPLVPTIAAFLLPLELESYDLSRLRYITNTAAALPTTFIAQIRQRLPHVTLFSMYGLTECKRVSYLPPDQLDIRPDSVGRGMPNEEVYLVDEQGRRLPPGSTGELVVRGANVMKGYWEQPEATAARLKPGPLPGEFVLHTGDQFRMDEEGYLYFVARKDDVIKCRGEKVSPREVENVLYAHPAVCEAAVVGVPDPVFGQRIKAVVALHAEHSITVKELLRHCAAHLEEFLVPQTLEIRGELPKTSTGKINKQPLLEAASA